jgi:O-antigen ligase
VIEEIGNAPIFGHGREGMVTSGAAAYLLYSFGEAFPHPHQAYLQILLDNGFIGFFLVMPFFFYSARQSVTLVLNREDPLVCAVGCTSFSLVVALLVGAFGGQTFYPREGSVGMWAAIGLMLRVLVQLRHAQTTGEPVFPDQLPAKYFVGGNDAYYEERPPDDKQVGRV